MWSRNSLLVAVVVPAVGLLPTGCSGLVHGGAGNSDGRRPGDPGSPNRELATEGSAPGLSHIRRLTHLEFNRTVADLFGDHANAADLLLPDARVEGFRSNFAAPTTQLDVEKYDEAAVLLAARADVAALAPCGVGSDELGCAADFVSGFGRRAYRRPLSAEETDRYTSLYSAKRAVSNYEDAIRLVLRALLQSPHFVYHVYLGEPTDDPGISRLTAYEMAERVSYFLTGTLPDDALSAAAESGELDTKEGLAAQVDRLLDDPRLEDIMGQFHREWLKLDDLETAQKDPDTYRAFTPEVRQAAAEETPRFAWEVYRENDGWVETLLTASFTYANDALAAMYGVPGPGGNQLTRIELDPSQRAGLLTQIGTLATHANFGQSSPIFRGVLVRERILCQPLPLPPANLDIIEPEVDPNVSTRERFAAHREDPACSGCHSLIDPIGFGFESYDGIGQHRTTDAGEAVDDTGEVTGAADADGAFKGAVELAHQLAASETVRDCVADQWFRFALGRENTPDDQGTLQGIRDQYASSGHTIRSLLRAISTSAPFRYVRVAEGG